MASITCTLQTHGEFSPLFNMGSFGQKHRARTMRMMWYGVSLVNLVEKSLASIVTLAVAIIKSEAVHVLQRSVSVCQLLKWQWKRVTRRVSRSVTQVAP